MTDLEIARKLAHNGMYEESSCVSRLLKNLEEANAKIKQLEDQLSKASWIINSERQGGA